jgi:hypothetical protein
MRVCHTVFQQMPAIASWKEFASRVPGVADLLTAQQKLGLQLCWLAPSAADHVFRKDAIKVRFVRGWDQARLYMHFIKDDLRDACAAFIDRHPALRQRVFLRAVIAERFLALYTDSLSTGLPCA